MKEKKESFWQILRQMWSAYFRALSYTKGSRISFFGGMFLMTIQGTVNTVLVGIGIKLILSAAQTGDMARTVQTILWIFGIVAGLNVLCSYGDCWKCNGTAMTSKRIRLEFMRKIMRIPQPWYDTPL